MLERSKSLCEKHQKIIVFKDKRTQRFHKALNNQENFVRHYQVDGDVIGNPNIQKCDYLLINDSKKNAYLIELKGTDLKHAIGQLENTSALLKDELKNYQIFFRIVYRGNTHAIRSSDYIKFNKKYCGRVKAATDQMAESI